MIGTDNIQCNTRKETIQYTQAICCRLNILNSILSLALVGDIIIVIVPKMSMNLNGIKIAFRRVKLEIRLIV